MARAEFKNFWSSYRNWVWFASTCLAPIALQFVRHGVDSMFELTETLENGLIGLALSLVGTYYFCVFNGAKALDAARAIIESDLKDQIERLTPPKRTSSEQHHYDEAKMALTELGENSRIILRHVKKLGKLILLAPPPVVPGIPSPQSPLPKGMSPKDAYESLEKCVEKSLLSREFRHVPISPNHQYPNTYIDYHIAEGMKEVLDDLLYSRAS